MQVSRVSYFVPMAQVKQNGENLSDKDLINIGYMAGRFGINLNNNPNEPNYPVYTNDGVFFNINSCTSESFMNNLKNSGIHFTYFA